MCDASTVEVRDGEGVRRDFWSSGGQCIFGRMYWEGEGRGRETQPSGRTVEEEGNGSIWRGSHVSNVRGGRRRDRGLLAEDERIQECETGRKRRVTR